MNKQNEEWAPASANTAHSGNLIILSDNTGYQSQIDRAVGFEYRVRSYSDKQAAIDAIRADEPNLLLVDEDLKGSTDIDFINEVRHEPSSHKIPIVYTLASNAVEKMRAADRLGAVQVLEKPYRKSALYRALAKQASSAVEDSWNELEPIQKQALQGTLESFNKIADAIANGEPAAISNAAEQCKFLDEAIRHNQVQGLLNGVKQHDNYSYVHSVRIAAFLGLLGNHIGIKGDDLNVLTSGGLLHDVGKLSIPHEVLNKPGRLSSEEFETMKGHVKMTIDTLSSDASLPKGISIIAGQHHEKIDGSGYPRGLKGHELNDLARMAAIADVFGALTDRRIYKPAMPPEDALVIMKSMEGHLDQYMLPMFREMLLDNTISP